VKFELLTHMGTPIGAIIQAEKQIPADVVLMGTHGRRGFSHVFLGSVAEAVVRQSYCPVLTVHSGIVDQHLVGHWMTPNPLTADPTEKLLSVQKRMTDGKFRSLPVVKNGQVIGIITDRDIRRKTGNEIIHVQAAMSRDLLTVTPQTSVWDAARLLFERKIGGMPVLDDQLALVGIITTSDLLRAFAEMQNA
jgi:predicted transcriptional regulator